MLHALSDMLSDLMLLVVNLEGMLESCGTGCRVVAPKGEIGGNAGAASSRSHEGEGRWSGSRRDRGSWSCLLVSLTTCACNYLQAQLKQQTGVAVNDTRNKVQKHCFNHFVLSGVAQDSVSTYRTVNPAHSPSFS